MNPTIEQEAMRVYCIQLSPAGGNWPPTIRIHADTLSLEREGYTFKREGNIVGVVRGNVQAWWIEEETTHP